MSDASMYSVAVKDALISTDRALLDMEVIHGFLANSYWSPGIPREVVERAAANSLCFGVYVQEQAGRTSQVGFARVITDRATYAYLADVFVLPQYRERGLGKALMRAILDHPDLQNLRRFMLMTRDAHRLYEQFGFQVTSTPERVMERRDPDVYRRMAGRALP